MLEREMLQSLHAAITNASSIWHPSPVFDVHSLIQRVCGPLLSCAYWTMVLLHSLHGALLDLRLQHSVHYVPVHVRCAAGSKPVILLILLDLNVKVHSQKFA